MFFNKMFLIHYISLHIANVSPPQLRSDIFSKWSFHFFSNSVLSTIVLLDVIETIENSLFLKYFRSIYVNIAKISYIILDQLHTVAVITTLFC